MFIGRTDVEAETPILWPPDGRSWLIGPWCWERLRAGEKEMTEDELVGWHQQLHGHGFGWSPGAGDGQGGLVCFVVHGVAKNPTRLSNWTELSYESEKAHTYVGVVLFNNFFQIIVDIHLGYKTKTVHIAVSQRFFPQWTCNNIIDSFLFCYSKIHQPILHTEHLLY